MSINVISTDNFPVPVKIIVESRNSSRVSLGKSEIIVRLPKHISVVDKEKTLKQFLAWAKKQIHEKKYYQEHQHSIAYYQGKTLQIFQTTFTIDIEFIAGGKNKLSYRGENVLKIYLHEHLSDKKQVQEIQRFLLRFTERYFLPEIQRRTSYWNDIYFRETIQKVDLKHTISRWGSCSAARKISFSTKLLLTPPSVIDYVIVHELAHLKEMNHSSRFWKHVAAAMPDYAIHRKWLQQNGSKISF
ncbi:MAG: M48 family metallopeptidase [Sphingobacteriales bacterium]|nr:M48 family metallopeptidase [Sphingobacteriales bacterium]